MSPCKSWLGCWAVHFCVRPRPVPCHFRLGCAVWVCVFAWALRLCPANPGWGSWCVCLGLGFCFQPANPGRGVGVCVFVCALCLYLAFLEWCVRCGCVCFGPSFGCTPPFLGGVFRCVYGCAPPASTPPILAGVVVACALVRVMAFTPPILAGVWGVCVCVRAPPVPCLSWLQCAVWLCVL